MAFDGNPAFTFEVHRIQELILHLALLYRMGGFEEAIGERRLSVVDVGNDTKVPDVVQRAHRVEQYNAGRICNVKAVLRPMGTFHKFLDEFRRHIAGAKIDIGHNLLTKWNCCRNASDNIFTEGTSHAVNSEFASRTGRD